jgi:hypothetical protein
MGLAVCLANSASLAATPTPASEQQVEQLTNGAPSYPSIWLTSGFVSRHFANQNQYTQANPGLGLALKQNDNWTFTAGRFRNSLGDSSRYVQAQWAPSALQTKWGELKMLPSISAGVVDGYKVERNGKIFPTALPLVKFEYRRIGLNLIYVPSIAGKVDGAIALQASLRIFQ